MSNTFEKKVKRIKVKTGDLKSRSSDYKDYHIGFVQMHFPEYVKKYGAPSSKEDWGKYRSSLKRDMRAAMNDDDVPARWKEQDVFVGAIVDILMFRFSFASLVYNSDMTDTYLRAVYDEEKCVYQPIENVPAVFHAMQGLNGCGLSKSKCEDIYHTISGLSDIVDIRCNPYEIPCESYLYNEKTGEKVPYGENVYITYHGSVDYDPKATNPHIHNDDDDSDWDFDSWLLDLFDNDPERVEFFWQIVARLVRPFRPANGIVLFTATTGNNGKGTLISLFRDLVGKCAWTSVPLAEFADRFGLKDLLTAQVVLTDENRMEFNFDGADRLKAAADGSTFKVEIKHKGYIKMKFPGLMIQCVNEMPRIKDKSGSWYRRLAVMPFNKSFTGRERKYIKNDYLKRPEVLAYVKKRAIETKVEDIDLHDLMPEKCIAAFEDYKLMNDPIRQYWDDISKQLVWDKVPAAFLYDLYCAWNKRNNPSGSSVSKIVFNRQLVEIVKDDPLWISRMDQNDTIRPDESNEEPEYLILEYDLKLWENPSYRGTNPYQRLQIKLPERFRGVVRVIDNKSLND